MIVHDLPPLDRVLVFRRESLRAHVRVLEKATRLIADLASFLCSIAILFFFSATVFCIWFSGS